MPGSRRDHAQLPVPCSTMVGPASAVVPYLRPQSLLRKADGFPIKIRPKYAHVLAPIDHLLFVRSVVGYAGEEGIDRSKTIKIR